MQCKCGAATNLTINSRECKFNMKKLSLEAASDKEEKEDRNESTDSNIIATAVI